MGEVGADPTTPEETDLQSAAVADLLLSHIHLLLVRVAGFEPSIASIKSRVPYLSATRAYYGGKPRYRPEHLGVADHCLTSWLVYHLFGGTPWT